MRLKSGRQVAAATWDFGPADLKACGVADPNVTPNSHRRPLPAMLTLPGRIEVLSTGLDRASIKLAHCEPRVTV